MRLKPAQDYLKPLDAPSGHPAPLPLMGVERRPEFPIHALPPVLREAVEEVQEFVQCPLALVVSSALGVLSTVAQGLVLVRRASSLIGPVSLFAVSIAEPNERKSTAEGFFTKPLNQWQTEQDILYANELNDYKSQLVVFEAIESRLHKDIKATDAGPELDELQNKLSKHLKENRPIKPLRPSVVKGDANKESLIKYYSEDYPIAGFITAEGGALFGGNSLSQSSIIGPLAFYNSLWSNEDFRVSRAGDGSTKLHNVALSISVAVQPDVIETFLDKGDAMARGIGFVARSLFCFPESTQGKRLYREPPKEIPSVDALNDTVSVLLKLLPEHIERRTLKRKVVNLTPEAKQVWIDYYNEIEQQHAQGAAYEFVRDVAGKSADNAARIAGLFHLVDTDNPYLIGDEISESHMKSAVAVARFYLDSAKSYLAKTDTPENIRLAQHVSDRLASYYRKRRDNPDSIRDGLQPNQITLRELKKKAGKKVNALPSINPLLEELLASHHIVDRFEGKNKSSVIIEINPQLAGDAQ